MQEMNKSNFKLSKKAEKFANKLSGAKKESFIDFLKFINDDSCKVRERIKRG